MRSVQKPYIITLKRTVEIEMTRYGHSAAEARQWAEGYEMDDLQHMGNIVRDDCRITHVRRR